nr:PREDICTED: uncharacterized protein LOC109043358 [Bemisia tabaci]
MSNEEVPLLSGVGGGVGKSKCSFKGLSLFFASLCVIDLFGVFPIVALPRAIVDCGWLGLPLAFTVFTLQIYTALLLGRSWVMAEMIEPSIVEKSRYPYAALAELTFNTRMRKFVTFLLDITIFGGGVPNLLVASQNLQILGLKISNFEWDVSYCYWMLLLGVALCPAMWLGSPKDMKWLAASSVCIVVTVGALTWYLLLHEPLPPGAVPPDLPEVSWQSLAIAYGILAFQFDIHPMILTVQVDMEKKNKLGHAILAGFLVSGGLSIVTCIIIYLRFGTSINYNILPGLQPHILLYVDAFLVTLQICLSMVVGGTALFQDVEDKLGVPRDFNWKRCVVRSSILMTAVLIGEAVPRFDLVMGLLGGALTGPLMFILPPIIHYRLRSILWRKQLIARIDRYEADGARLREELLRKTTLPPQQLSYAPNAFGLVTNDMSTGKEPIPTGPASGSFSSETSSSLGSLPQPYLPPSELLDPPLAPRSLVQHLVGLVSTEVDESVSQLGCCELAMTFVIVGAGITATVVATYYALVGNIAYATFSPPCIVSVNEASRAIFDELVT